MRAGSSPDAKLNVSLCVSAPQSAPRRGADTHTDAFWRQARTHGATALLRLASRPRVRGGTGALIRRTCTVRYQQHTALPAAAVTPSLSAHVSMTSPPLTAWIGTGVTAPALPVAVAAAAAAGGASGTHAGGAAELFKLRAEASKVTTSMSFGSISSIDSPHVRYHR